MTMIFYFYFFFTNKAVVVFPILIIIIISIIKKKGYFKSVQNLFENCQFELAKFFLKTQRFGKKTHDHLFSLLHHNALISLFYVKKL